MCSGERTLAHRTARAGSHAAYPVRERGLTGDGGCLTRILPLMRRPLADGRTEVAVDGARPRSVP